MDVKRSQWCLEVIYLHIHLIFWRCEEPCNWIILFHSGWCSAVTDRKTSFFLFTRGIADNCVRKPKRWIDLEHLKTERSGNSKMHADFLIASPWTHGFQTMTPSKNKDFILLCQKMSSKIRKSEKSDWALCRSSNFGWFFIFISLSLKWNHLFWLA